MKKLFFVLLLSTLATYSMNLQAQDQLDLPPELELSAPGEPSSTLDHQELIPPPTDYVESALEPIPSGDIASENAPLAPISVDRAFDCLPAVTESTGTWVRRGFWSAEVDITLLDRIWRRDDLTIIQDTVTNTGLSISGGRFGAEGSPRLKLNRFLFRDQKNRDHTLEFVILGGGQWTHEGRLDVTAGTLAVPAQLDRFNTSFDGATSTQFTYDNRLNSFELNYHVKARMLKDRMELEPTGQWVRRAQPSNTRSILAGIRYVDVTDSFSWDAFGIADNDNDGFTEEGHYRIDTDNDMIGPQMGVSWTHERARWSLGLQSKVGTFWNHTNLDSKLNISGNLANGESHSEIDNISFVTEGAAIGKWHLSPNFSLRASMEILYVSSLAHAVEFIDFAPSLSTTNFARGDTSYMGGAIGFEGYW